MKKLLLLIVMPLFYFISEAKTTNQEMYVKNYLSSHLMKPIYYTYTTSNGYTIVVSGNVGWTWTNPWHFSFIGTVTVTGNGVNISLPISGNFVDGSGSVNIYSEDNPLQEIATHSEWQTTSSLANELLNSADFDSVFIDAINN